MWVRTPPPALADHVLSLWGGDAEAPYACHRMLPNGEVMVMFNLGPPQRVVTGGGAACGEIHRTAWVCGLQERPLALESTIRHPRAVAVQLRPLGAWALFAGLPLRDLANEMIDLEAVLGGLAGVGVLRQRLVEAPDLGVALDRVEEWLVARILGGPSAHPITSAALAHLARGGGDVRIAPLARELGVSSRYLNALFHRQVGVSAKSVARIVRLGRALEALAARRGGDLVRLALDCGYFDQSHLNREFREVIALTPTEYLASMAHTLHRPDGLPG
jgi:AraC-like DNA-binding protein